MAAAQSGRMSAMQVDAEASISAKTNPEVLSHLLQQEFAFAPLQRLVPQQRLGGVQWSARAAVLHEQELVLCVGRQAEALYE